MFEGKVEEIPSSLQNNSRSIVVAMATNLNIHQQFRCMVLLCYFVGIKILIFFFFEKK